MMSSRSVQTHRRSGGAGLLLAPVLLLAALLAVPAPGQQSGAESTGVAEARAALQQAVQALGADDLDRAIELLEPFRGDDEATEPLLATLGALYAETGRPRDALEVLAPLAEGEDADAAVLYNAGRAALAAGEPARAEEFLERSVELQGGTPAARELGLLRGAQKRYRNAFRLLRPWALAHPDDVEARRAAALCAVQLGRVADAEELLAGLAQSDPRTGLLWGRVLLLKGQPQAALAVLEPLVESADSGGEDAGIVADARRVLAEVYLEIGESERAIDLLEELGTGEPSVALLLARARYQSGDLHGALDSLRPFAEPLAATGLDRSDPRFGLATSIAREYGRWLVNAGRHEEAVVFLRLATEGDPEAKDSWKALGQALAATGDREAAREALTRFQELAREEGSESEQVDRAREERADPTARALRRASELMDEERAEEALQVLRDERQLASDDLRLPILESRALMVLGRHAEALEVAEEAVRMAPRSPDALYQRGAANLGKERLDAARRDFQRSLELDPNHVAAMNDLAVLLIVQGERDEARRLLERVLELRPGDRRAARTLERLGSTG